MGWSFRKSKKVGPLRFTVSRRGLTTSAFGYRHTAPLRRSGARTQDQIPESTAGDGNARRGEYHIGNSLNSTESEEYLRAYARIDKEAAKLQSHVTEARASLSEVAQQLGPLPRRIAYLRAASLARSLVESTVIWKPGAVALASLSAGATSLFTTGSMTAFSVATGVTGILSTMLLWIPSGARSAEDLAAEVVELTNDKLTLQAQADALTQRVAELSKKTDELEARADEIEGILSGERRRLALSHENWKAMRGPELENYLVEVFAALGYSVETIGGTGDHGVDLIVEKHGIRFAIQVKGYTDSVSNSAVQQAYSGMAFYDCDECVVVTNSRFTRNARAIADKVGCILIGEDQITDLILGRYDLIALTADID